MYGDLVLFVVGAACFKCVGFGLKLYLGVDFSFMILLFLYNYVFS